MQTFTLTEAGIQHDIRKTVRIFIISLTLGAFIGLYAASGGDFSSLPVVWWVGIAAAMLLLGGFRMNMHTKRRRSLLHAVRLVINHDGLVYRSPQAVTYTVGKDKIKDITLLSNGKIKIRSEGNLPIFVPAYIERKDELVKALGELHAVKQG